MHDSRLPRRHLLRKLGLGAAVLPFLPILDREREAKGAAAPRRLVLVWAGGGPYMPAWTPTGTEASFTLGTILKPFEKHRSKLIVLSGVNKIPARGDEPPLIKAAAALDRPLPSNHVWGCCASWTAELNFHGDQTDGTSNYGWEAGPSVDQYIAGRLNLRTLELGIVARRNDAAARMIYKGANLPLSPENDPFRLFARLFADMKLGSAAFEQVRAERRSIIDFIKGDLARLAPKIGKADRQKTDIHLQAIRSIEETLQSRAPACGSPPGIGAPVDALDDGNIPFVFAAHNKLMALALSCDFARIGSLQIGEGRWPSVPRWDPVGITQGVSGVSTDTGSDLHLIGHHVEVSEVTTAAQAAEAQQKIIKTDTWISTQVADLIDQLEAAGVMQETLLVMDRELSGTTHHTNASNPYLIVQGSDGPFKTGRWVKCGPSDWNRDVFGAGQPHCKLLVSICHAMGLTDVTDFGNKTLNTMMGYSGPLPGLTG